MTVPFRLNLFTEQKCYYEYRHINDLKFAHPKSLASPVERPKLGRPKASTLIGGTTQTEVGSPEVTLPNRFPHPPSVQKPHPPSVEGQKSKQGGGYSVGNQPTKSHETSNLSGSEPPSPTPAGNTRPIRASRNPNPIYVDAISRPWSASPADIAEINRSIQASRVSDIVAA